MRNDRKPNVVINIVVIVVITKEEQGKDDRLGLVDNTLSELQAGVEKAFNENDLLWVDCLIQKGRDIARVPNANGCIQ
jgi:hypothetical protein